MIRKKVIRDEVIREWDLVDVSDVLDVSDIQDVFDV